MAADTDVKTVEIPNEDVIEVDISDLPDLPDAGVLAEKEKPAPKPAAKVVATPSVDEAAESLKAAIKVAEDARKAAEATAAAERRRADEAQRLAQQREQEASRYRESAETSQLTIVLGGIAAAKQQMESAQRDYVNAMEAADFVKSGEAQVRIASAAASLDRLEDAKALLEAEGARKTTEGRVEAQPQPQHNDQVEQYLRTMAPRAQSWLRQHPECLPPQFGGDPVKNAEMMEGHYAALRNRVAEGSDDYFRTIEEKAGYRQPMSAAAVTTNVDTEADHEPAPAPKPRARPAPVAAPVSRDAPSGPGQRTRSVTLTKEQAEAAVFARPDLAPEKARELYARNLVAVQNDPHSGYGRAGR